MNPNARRWEGVPGVEYPAARVVPLRQPNEMEELAKLYRSHMPVKEIASRLNRSTGWVYRNIRDALKLFRS